MSAATPEWVRDAVFYQIFPDRFAMSERIPKPANLQAWDAPPTYHGFKGGDLLGISEHIDYLRALNVNAVYLNPIFASASNHRYHTHDYFEVDPLLGGNAAFEHLLGTLHANGMRVILDGVFNHASRGFFQFNHLLECGHESPYTDWFHVHGWPINAYQEHEPANYAAWWGLHALPKFNTDNPAVREFLFNVAEYWLKEGIDGWRLDVPSEIDDDDFWREFRRRCKAINPEAYLVGELWGEASRWLKGDQFDAQMNYPFTRAVFGFAGGHLLDQSDTVHTGLGYIEPLDGPQFAAALGDMHHRLPIEIVQAQMNMVSSHDTPRVITIANGDWSTVRLIFICQMTVAGAPNIYYGDEIGLPGNRDPDCRRAFPWQDPAQWNAPLLEFVRRLTALRQQTPALRRGDFAILHAARRLVVYRRSYEGQVAVIALNAGNTPEPFSLSVDVAPQTLADALYREGVSLEPGAEVRVPARAGRVWVSSEP